MGLAHPKDVRSLLHLLFHQNAAGLVDDLDGPVAGGFKGLVVGSRIPRRLCHKADVGDRCQRVRGVQGSVLPEVFNHA